MKAKDEVQVAPDSVFFAHMSRSKIQAPLRQLKLVRPKLGPPGRAKKCHRVALVAATLGVPVRSPLALEDATPHQSVVVALLLHSGRAGAEAIGS